MKFIEDLKLELKEVFVAGIKKEIIAFANTKGGTIYIGIADGGDVTGLKHPEDVLLQVGNTIRDSIKPDITLFVDSTIEILENKKVVKIIVQQGVDKPYYLREKGLKPSGVYVRQGNASVPASESLIRQMIKETDGDTFEIKRSLNQELTFEYIAREMEKKNIEFGLSQMKTLGIINNDALYTNLGLLVSDQCPHSIKIAYFEGKDKSVFKDRKEFNGSVIKQLFDAYQYIDLMNMTKATFSGIERIDKRDYPPEAIREALLNVIVHREYSFSGSALINIYYDKIEFISLGGLVPGLSIDAILLGVSQSRNERLSNIFYRLRLIEAYGTGITKIVSSYEGHKNKPIIKAVDGAFKVILSNMNLSGDIMNNEFRQEKSISLQSQKILDQIKKQNSITRNEIQTTLNIGQSRALTIIKGMIEAKQIVQIGKGKNTRYYLNG